MSENLDAFKELVKSDPEFGKAAAKMEVDELIVAAKERGVTLTKEDFKPKEGELSEVEAKNVAGGGACFCALAGGGGGTDDIDHNTYGCACVAYGQGGDGRASDANCVCYIGGVGEDFNQWY